MTGPFTPPTDSTRVVPPNRARPQPFAKTIGLWVLLMVLFVALYNILGTPSSEAPKTLTSEAGSPLGYLLPLFTYGTMLLLMVLIRRRLPAKYRTGELREIEAPRAEEPQPAPSPPPIDLSLVGTDGARPVRLRVDDAGLHWFAEARLLKPAQELNVAWAELESIQTARVSGPLLVWGLVVIFASASMYSVWPVYAAIGALAALGLTLLHRRGAKGMLAFSTASHVLSFQSAALDLGTQDALMAAARARCPRAVVKPTEGKGAWFALLIEPFSLPFRALKDDAALRAELLRQGSTLPQDHSSDEAIAGLVQVRLYWLWRGLLGGIGPLSTGLGLSAATASAWAFFSGWLLSWVFGLILLGKTTRAFARFSGMRLIR